MSGRLADKIAVVTGGSTGIGFATAKLMAEEGAHVVITGRRQEALDRAVASIGERATAVSGDIKRAEDRQKLVERISAVHGRVDILFANAGTGDFGRLGAISEAQFDEIVAVNLKGTLFTIQDLLPLMSRHGSIIVTGSTSSVKGYPELVVYGITKAGLRSLVRSAAAALAERQIRVNMLSPGTTDTPMVAPMGRDALDAFASTAPLARVADPIEIARVALFLASDDSSYVTGVELFADGGAAQV